jgi:hypothetical protein
MEMGRFSGQAANRMMRIEASGALALLFGVLLTGTAFGQARSATTDPAQPAAQEAPKKDEGKKPALADVTRVSTEEAARSAAKEKSKQGDEKVEVEEEKSSHSGVTEFRPARPDEKSSAEAQNASGSGKNPKGRTLKNVHGTVHGATDSSGRDNRTGAAVGASSSSGKTSIYVETDRGRENSPRP